jgi:hypothetical protein
MNNLLVAAILCLPGAARAANLPALEAQASALEDGAGAALSDLERSLKTLSGAGPFGAAAPDDWVPAERSRAYCAKNPWPLDAVKSPGRIWYMCEAIAAGDPAVCYEMGPNSRVSIFFKHSDCVRGFWNLRLARAVIAQSPDLEPICRNHEDFRLEFSEKDRSVVCGALRGGTPKSLCELLRDKYPDQFRHPDLKDCVTDNEIFWGTNEHCDAFGDTGYEFMEEQICVASSRYRKAFAARDPGLCKDSAICRALMGDAKACDAPLAALRADACKPATSSHQSGARAGVLAAEIDAALSATLRRPMAPSEKAAAKRLHAVMTGDQPVEPQSVAADVVTLRLGVVGDLVSRAELICEAIAGESAVCRERLAGLRRLGDRAKKAAGDFGRDAGVRLEPKSWDELFAR